MYSKPFPIVVAISGKAGSGKTTIADYMLRSGYPYTQMHITLPLKHLVADQTNTRLSDNIVHRHMHVGGMTLAQHQEVTDKKMRKCGGDGVFVAYLIELIKKSCYPYLVVDDLRLLVELERLKIVKASFIRINRPLINRLPHLYGRNPNTKTEVDLDDYDGFDLVIENNTTIESMYRKIDEYLAESI